MKGKTKMFTVRMTEQDFKIISAKAELEGVSIAEFLRSAALGKRVEGFSKKRATADIDSPLEPDKVV